MSKRILTSAFGILFLIAFASAAPPERRTPLDASFLRDYAETRGFLLGRPVKPKPTPDGKAVLFLRAQARVPKMSLYEFDVATGKTRELLTPEKLLQGAEENLTPEEKARRERQRISVGGFTDFHISDDGNLVLVQLAGRLYTMDRKTSTVTELKTGKGTLLDPKFSPDGRRVSYVLDHDVYILDLETRKETRVTTGGAEDRTHGLAEFVAQEEMRRYTGYWWSPDGRQIAYEQADATDVETWFVADPIKPEQSPHPTRYPRPGKANVKVRLGIIAANGGETVWVDWDRTKYEYLAAVRWDSDAPLTLVLQDRLQQHQDVFTVDAATGKTKLVHQRHSVDAWVEIDPALPRWLSDGSLLTFGGMELNVSGKVLSSPREGRTEEYRSFVSLDSETRQIYYLGNEIEEPGEMHLYRSRLPNGREPFGKPERVSTEAGVHAAVFSKDHSIYVLTATTPGRMPRSIVHRADGTRIGELPAVAENPGFEPRVEFLKQPARSRDYHAAVILPHHFDATKKYPVLVDVYGGPHHQTVVKSMRNWLLAQWMADQGFVVVAFDNRGTPGRGLNWEGAIYKKFGSVPLDDQVEALTFLGSRLTYLDLNRVGIYGWSFGGYMSALAVLKRPDVFKAAVAGAPVTDWEDYDTHYTERYLGLPKDNPEVYREASLLTYADKLERPLLLVHGTADDNVYFRHTLKLSDALFRAGKDFEVLPLSGLTHMVPDPVVTQRLWGRIAGHFQKHLGDPK